MIAFAILACLLVCTMGHKSFSLAAYSIITAFGLALIAAAVLASFALMQYFGQKMTPFTVQAIPMLLLGIGVDYLVMMCHCIEKAEMSTVREGRESEVRVEGVPPLVETDLVMKPVKTRIKEVELGVVTAAMSDGGVAIAASALGIAGGCLAAAAAACDLSFV